MKTKIKRHSRSVISVILAVCMLISCMTVGIIATDAAKTAEERVGANVDSEAVGFTGTNTVYFKNTATWSSVYVHFYSDDYGWKYTNEAHGGSQSDKNWIAAGQMSFYTTDNGVDIYSYTYTGTWTYIAFTEGNQYNGTGGNGTAYDHFWSTKLVPCNNGYAAATPMCDPGSSTSGTQTNSCNVYRSYTWEAEPEIPETKFDVDITAGTGGKVKIDNGSPVTSDTVSVGDITTAEVQAVADPGYTFTKWTVTGGVTGVANNATTNPVTAMGASAEGALTANFDKVNLTVTPVASPAGAATVAVDYATRQIGQTVTVTVSDIDDKYTLDNVKYTANGADTNITMSSGSGTFTMPGYNTTVTASFNEKSGTLTVSNDDAKGTPSYSSQTVSSVTTTALPTVVAETGYTFDGYLVTSGTVYGKGGSADTAFESTDYIPGGTAVNLRGNATVTAQYTLNSHELSWTDVEGEHSFDVKIGDETINSGRSVDYGTTVNVTANGVNGNGYKYFIDTVTGVTLSDIEGEGTDTLTGSFTMPDDSVTLGVTKRQAYEVTILPVSHGTLTVTSSGIAVNNGDFIVSGTTLNITLETDEGYTCASSSPILTKNAESSTTSMIVYEGTLTVDSAKTISASLAAIPQKTVTVVKTPDKGTIKVSYTKNEKAVTKEAYAAPITVDNGTEVTVWATPTTDYKVKNISFNGTDNAEDSESETSEAYTVNGEDVAATVSFAHVPVALYLGNNTKSEAWGLTKEATPFTDNGDGTFSYLTGTVTAGTYYVYVATSDADKDHGTYWKSVCDVDDKTTHTELTTASAATVARYDNGGNYGQRNGSFTFTAPQNRKYRFTFDPENLELSVVGTIKHIKPEISFANNGTVNAGSSVILTVTNHAANTALSDTGMSYEVKRGDTTLISDTDYTFNDATGQITILNPQAGSYTVKAITTETVDFADSDASDAAALTVYTPKYTLMGNVGSTDISNVTNSVESHDSTATRGWPKDDRVNDSVYYTGNSSVRVDGTIATPGIYTISFTTASDKDSIDIGLYETSVGQTALDIDGFRPTVRQDYWVPSEGKSGIDIISNPEDVSSLKFKPGVTYTITINQITGTMNITSNAADCTVVARVLTFNSTTGGYNDTPANATAAIGRATSKPSTGIGTTYTSKLTATVVDTDNYDFIGWYDNADCTGTEISTDAEYNMTVTVSEGDKVYYALFKQKTPDLKDVVVSTTGSGSVTASAITSNGIQSGSGTEIAPYQVYSGATVRLTATPVSGNRIKSVTSTSGTVSVSGNYITITNVTADAEVAVAFEVVPTNAVTVVADSSSHGKFSVKYYDADGVEQTIASTSTTQTFNAKENTVVEVTAAPNEGGIFTGWTMTGDYSRSKTTPLTATVFKFVPLGTVTATAGFEASDITGDQIIENYYIKVAKKKTDTYKINVPLYRTVNSTSNANEFRSYFTIGDTDDPANGKLKAGENYWFIISSKSGDASVSDSHYNAQLDINKTPSPATDWSNNCKGEDQGGKYAWLVNFKSNAKKATMYWGKRSSTGQWNGWFDEEDSKYYTAINVTTGTAGSDDTPSTTGYTKLYVLDGTITRYNNSIQNYGTNTFGDSKIISSNSGVLKMNYYDAEDGDEFIFSNDTHSEGQRIYWYNAAENLDFRVQTTIKSGHQAIGVRAFVMNGLTYPARKSANGVYYADITLEAGSNQGVLEVIPVYYNIHIPAEDYIKFYVDANTLGTKFGKTIGYSVWYNDTSYHGETGGYPGQPLMSDGSLLYGYFPRYWVDNNASATPDASNRSNKFAGVLLTNLSEHNYTHQDVLTAWSCDKGNYQSFDYEDPVAIANIDDVDMIEFVAKYKELSTTHRYDSSYSSRTLNGNANKAWPASISPRPTTAADALEKGFEYLTDIDGKRVNIFNENNKTLTGDPIYVVSVGNQQVTPNDWDTVWEVYTATGNSIAAARPVDFINRTEELETALESYTNSPVLINYEGWLAGESNTGTRFDGRWLYSRSSDDTTLRLRVATKDASGNLTFMTNGINWAEINDGATNVGELEAADETNYTKILNLEDRLTEVNAKINPVGYSVYGFYMLGAAYSDETDNGFSSKLSDYDNLNVSGSATSFVNSKDNRMVIVVEQIPAADLVVTHQLYLGEGAHKIPGFFTVKAEIIGTDGTTVEHTYDFAKSLSLSGFTSNAPYGSNKTLRITLKSQMSGVGTSFNRWYENDHNNGYNDVNSTAAHGQTGTVTKVIDLAVNDFYNVDEQSNTSLKFQNIDYYSDLQSAGSVNINHYLLKETTDLGLTGTTYVQTTVVTSAGTPVAGGSDVARITSDEVSSDFITVENAEAGYEIKIEIWTKANGTANFDKFYKNTTTEMVTETDSYNDIYYTIGNTKTFNGEEYESAIIYVPINYFFKEDTNAETGDIIKVFDATKRNFNLYSSLTETYHYSLTYQYTSRLYGVQTYTSKGDLTSDQAKDYFTLNEGVLTFKDNATMQNFLAARAPYEDNFKEKITWDFSTCNTNQTTFGTLDGVENTIYLTNAFESSQESDDTIHIEFEFPYAFDVTKKSGVAGSGVEVGSAGDYDVAVAATTTTDENYTDDKNVPINYVQYRDSENVLTYQPVLQKNVYDESGNRSDNHEIAGQMRFLDWISLNTCHNSKDVSSDKVPDNAASFITAPEKVVVSINSSDPENIVVTEKSFIYWNVQRAIKNASGSTVYSDFQKCYSKEFNLPIYQDCRIIPVYGDAEAVTLAHTARTTGVAANLSFVENSRNQWNNNGGGTSLPQGKDYWQNFGDRVYSDFVISFDYKNQQLNVNNSPYRAGLIIENLGAISGENTSNAAYQSAYEALDQNAKNTIKNAAIAAVSGNTDHKSKYGSVTVDEKSEDKYYFSYINLKKLDPRNAIEYYYTFANVSMTEANENNGIVLPTAYKDRCFRAFSFIVNEDGTVVTVSEPIYFTIHDIATVADGNTLD